MATTIGASFSQITSFTTPTAVSTGLGLEFTNILIGSDVTVHPSLEISTVICWPLVGFSTRVLLVEAAPWELPSTKNSYVADATAEAWKITGSPVQISAGSGFVVMVAVNEGTTFTTAMFETWVGELVPSQINPLKEALANLLNSVVEVNCPLRGS